MEGERTRPLRRQYFVIFLVASVGPVLLTGTASFFSVQEALAARSAQDNTILAESVATVVANQISEISASAEDAAGDPALRSALSAGANASELASALEAVAPRHRQFAALGVASRDGEVIANWPASETWMDGRNLSDENFLAVHISVNGSLQSGIPTYVSGVFLFNAFGGSAGPFIALSTAIRDNVEAEQGILLAFVATDTFVSAVPPLPARQITALLFDGAGAVIASRTSQGMSAHLTDEDRAAQERAAFTGVSGNTRTASSDPQIMAFAPATSGQTRWFVVLRLPLSVVYSEASPLLILSAGIVVLAAAAAVALAVVLAGRTVGPIVALTEATRDLARAQDLPPAITDRRDEIGMLSRSFAQMAAAVKNESESNRRLIARLEELERLKSALVDTVSHELRTPITVIRGNAELLGLDASPTKEKISRASDRIIRASEQLAYLVEELIELGQLQARQSTIRAAPVSFDALLEEVRDLEDENASKLGVEVDITLGPGLPTLQADAAKLRIAVRNLLSNAIKFSNRGSKVTLSAAAKESGVELRVIDHGAGIKPDEVAHIFEVFYQGEASLTRAHGGAGIGLALVRQFVELHHGRLEVETSEGKGSTFMVWLPVSPEAVSGEPSF